MRSRYAYLYIFVGAEWKLEAGGRLQRGEWFNHCRTTVRVDLASLGKFPVPRLHDSLLTLRNMIFSILTRSLSACNTFDLVVWVLLTEVNIQENCFLPPLYVSVETLQLVWKIVAFLVFLLGIYDGHSIDRC